MEKTGPSSELTDVAIIGGGPAGTAAALEARRRGLSATLWERSRFPHDKVCGGFLSAESLPLLAQEIPATLARAAIIRRSEFVSPRGRVYGFTLPQAARGLSRRALDQALWQAAASAGAKVREGYPVRGLRKVDGRARGDEGPGTLGRNARWEIALSSGETEIAQSVIVACGRWWALEGLASPARPGRQGTSISAGPWMGARAHFAGVSPRDAVEMYFFPGGYCGLAPIEDGLYNSCCLVHRGPIHATGARMLRDFAAWLGIVARHPVLDSRLRGASQVGETAATAPLRPAERVAEQNGALLVGDASGFLDPFTGDGISMALNSGRLAAELVAEEQFPERAAQRYGWRLERAVRKSYAVAALLRVLVSAPEWVQTSAAVALPWLGTHLLAATRWRPADS